MREPPQRLNRYGARPRRRRGPVALAAVAVAAVAIALAVSSGSGSDAPRGAAARGDTGGLEWHVPTSGPPPSLAEENRAAGTTDWQLRSAATRRPPALSAYVSSQSLEAGDLERVYADAPGSSWIEAAVYRIGWYGGSGGRLVLTTPRLAVASQPPCAHSDATGLTECRWRPTFSMRMPQSLASGVYIVKLSDSRGEQRDALFVLEAARPQPMLVELPVPTWQAYNNWGGDGLYPGYHRVGDTDSLQGVAASFARPYDSNTGAGQFFRFDVALVHYLEQHGYPASYTAGQSVDARPGQLDGHRVIVDSGHSEYWSQRELDAFSAARDRGTNLVFISSDTAAWRVRYAGQRMIGYKENAARDPSGQPATFPGLGARLTGSAFNKCITPPAGGGRYHYYSWHPTASMSPAWLFRGTGLTPASTVPGIVGYELDSTNPATPAGTIVVGSGSAPCRGAPGEAAAETTLYRAPSGALVFATGTLGWEFGLSPLPIVSPDVPRAADQRLVRLTDNVLQRMLQ